MHNKRIALTCTSICVIIVLSILPVRAQDLGDAFEIMERITLAEPEDVYTVFPHIAPEPGGGLIITDAEEAQVRIYDPSGEFGVLVGTRGRGPGEFQAPQVSQRLPDGRLVVGMLGGHLSVFDASNTFTEMHSGVLDAVTGAVVMPSTGELLLIGSPSREGGAHPLLHYVDPSSGRITLSFFPHPIPLGTYGNILSGVADLAVADARGRTVVAVFGPQPVLHLFRDDGSLLRRVPFELDGFRRLDAPERDEPLPSNAVLKAQTSYSRFTRAAWVAPDIVLLQYFDLIDLATWTVRHSLAAVRTDGTVLFERSDTPRLFGSDTRTGDLYFQDPSWETPERIVRARFRSEAFLP